MYLSTHTLTEETNNSIRIHQMRKQSSFDDEVTLSSAAMHLLPKKCSHQSSTQHSPGNLSFLNAPCPEVECYFFYNEQKDHISCCLRSLLFYLLTRVHTYVDQHLGIHTHDTLSNGCIAEHQYSLPPPPPAASRHERYTEGGAAECTLG